MSNLVSRLKALDFTSQPVVQAFGISGVATLPLQVQARVLNPPSIEYADSATVKPRVGVWSIKNQRFADARPLLAFAVINFAPLAAPEQVEAYMHSLLRCFKQHGMECVDALPDITCGAEAATQEEVEHLFRTASAACSRTYDAHPQIVFCFLPDAEGSQLYNRIKRASHLALGLQSQVLKAKHLAKAEQHVMLHLALKVNVKLGGLNQLLLPNQLPKMDKLTMILGADVAHPGASGSTCGTSQSVAAVVGCLDLASARYAEEFSFQRERVEEIQELKGMVHRLLLRFKAGNEGALPARILLYRDGVGESQFEQVLRSELPQIREACQSAAAGDAHYQPAVTFVVVQKRHHTRLFPRSSKDADSSGNVQAGTCVDTSICHPTRFDFYLCSHAGIRGTSRPAHYLVLWDEIGFSATQLHALTYRLCYSYNRCLRSVSLVPPVYYAHLVAAMAACYQRPAAQAAAPSDSSSAEAAPAPAACARASQPSPTLHPNLRGPIA